MGITIEDRGFSKKVYTSTVYTDSEGRVFHVGHPSDAHRQWRLDGSLPELEPDFKIVGLVTVTVNGVERLVRKDELHAYVKTYATPEECEELLP